MSYDRPMADHMIPTALADITPAMMTDGLRANGFDDADVALVEVERIAVGEGFLGELARLHLTYASGSGPATATYAASPTPLLGPPGHRSVLGTWVRLGPRLAGLGAGSASRL